MKLGIIGPEFSGKQIVAHLRAISPETEPVLYCRETSAEALDVIRQCEQECQAVLFTGRGPCVSVAQRHAITRTYEYVAKDSFSVMAAFQEMKDRGIPVDRVSVDTVAPYIVDDACCEVQLSPTHLYHFPFESFDEEEYMRWHQKLWDEGKIDAILTGFVRVYHHFRELGLPVFYLRVSRFTVREAYDRLMSRMELREARSAQIVVEVIELNSESFTAGNYYSDHLRACQAESCITEYCRKIEAAFYHSGPNRFIVVANRGSVKREENYCWLYQLQTEIAKCELQARMGIGFGSTAYQAEIHAYQALSHAKKTTGGYLFSIDEEGVLTGPLGSAQAISYELISTDGRLERIAADTGLSASHLSKLMALMQLRENNVFDVTELADCLSITVRSAHRVIHKLLEAGYAEVCGKESSGAGRPKSLIRLLLEERE